MYSVALDLIDLSYQGEKMNKTLSDVVFAQKPQVLTIFGVFLLLGVVVSCGRFMPGSRTSDTSDTNAVNTAVPSSPSFDSDKYSELLSKREEFAKLSVPVKLDAKAVFKGKIFIATNNLEKFSDYDLLDNGIADYRMAKSEEELETLIQVNCAKGAYVATYEGKYDRKVKGFAVNCTVSIVDHKTQATVARKSFSNSRPPGVISSIDPDPNDEYLMPRPLGDIARYINSFSVDKEIPTPNVLSEKELLRLSVKEALTESVAIKGKVMFAQKKDQGDINPYRDNTMYSGLGLSYGFGHQRLTSRPDELETLITIVCEKGKKIGKVGNTTQFSNKCEVSLIDYRSLTVFARKSIENTDLYENARKEDYPLDWIVGIPEQAITDYLASLPSV